MGGTARPEKLAVCRACAGLYSKAFEGATAEGIQHRPVIPARGAAGYGTQGRGPCLSFGCAAGSSALQSPRHGT